jgi:putative membrane protein
MSPGTGRTRCYDTAVSRELPLLTLLFWALTGWSAIHPYDAMDWWLEIATPVAGYLLLAATWRRFRFTPLAYRLMFLEGVVLIIGAHYTHERVPLFDWIAAELGQSRNDYDRLAHFAVGFLLVVPVRELLARLSPLRGKWLWAMSGTVILAWAAFYEIFEWWIAAAAAPDVGVAYLGSQGDPWDAQKDMLLDGVGAIVGLLVCARAHDRQLARRD